MNCIRGAQITIFRPFFRVKCTIAYFSAVFPRRKVKSATVPMKPLLQLGILVFFSENTFSLFQCVHIAHSTLYHLCLKMISIKSGQSSEVDSGKFYQGHLFSFECWWGERRRRSSQSRKDKARSRNGKNMNNVRSKLPKFCLWLISFHLYHWGGNMTRLSGVLCRVSCKQQCSRI